MTPKPPGRSKGSEASILFDGARLTLARQLAGLRKTDLAEAIKRTPTAVAAWETGQSRPTPAAVAQLSLCLSVDPGFFAVRGEDIAAISATPHFRSLRSTSQLARDQAAAFGLLAADVATSLERHVEFPAPSIPSYPVSPEDDESPFPELAARYVRQEWELGGGPIGHAVRLLERHGVLVLFSPRQSAQVDAYSFASRHRPVVILNPTKDDYYRQRFDLIHELGHLVMHGDAEPGGRVVENQANRFAAEFLMPADQVAGLLPSSVSAASWTTLARLKEQWGVSLQALLYRARTLGRISDVSHRNAMTSITTRGWRRDEPGLVKALEQPSLLRQAVELLSGEGISEATLMDECRVPARLFRVVTARRPEIQPVLSHPDKGNVEVSHGPVSLFDAQRTS